MIIRTSLVGLVIAAAVGIAACGSDNGISQDEADKLQKQSQELQRKAQKTADDVSSGKVDAEQAAKDIQDDASKLTNDALDAAKDSNIPDDVKKQLEDAQDQINAAGGGS
jgi:3-hydroxyisobutyrate dehydrogenase-like beta-hydroxyacid dehydrogenase